MGADGSVIDLEDAVSQTVKENAAEWNGKMIDVPIYKSAQRILSLANR